MHSQGRIADGQQVDLVPWQPTSSLRELSQEDARFSRGFLAAPPLAWFVGIAEHWMPLFHSLASDVVVRGYEKNFGFPKELSRTVAIEIDGEMAVLGFDGESYAALAQELVPGCSGMAADVVVEYLERRMLASLEKTWIGNEPLNAAYLTDIPGGGSSDRNSVVDVVASLGVMLEISGSPCTVWFGVGPNLVERLDREWRNRFLAAKQAAGENPHSDTIHDVRVELAELSVPPAMLIDYLRSGTIIDLEVSVSDQVRVRVDGNLWASGTLCQFSSGIAVEVNSTGVEGAAPLDATTQVHIEIAQTEVDHESLLEHAQSGAVLITDTNLSGQASLVISGEKVAEAVIGQIGENFALSILPKG